MLSLRQMQRVQAHHRTRAVDAHGNGGRIPEEEPERRNGGAHTGDDARGTYGNGKRNGERAQG